MAEDKKSPDTNRDGIDFDEAQKLTVGEVARKEAEIKAGITTEDNVLDRYIKQHRDKVAAEKFDTKIAELETLDTAALDDFIQKKQRELEEIEAVEEAVQAGTENSEQAEKDIAAIVDSTSEPEPVVPTPVVEPEPQNSQIQETFLDEELPSRKRRAIWAGVVALVLALLAFAFTWVNGSLNNTRTTSSSSTSSSKSSSSSSSSSESAATKEANQSFTDQYKTFFTDDKQTALKNDQFSKLSELKAKLDKLEGSSYYKAAKAKYDSLKAQIDAIQAVNSRFDSAAINNGKEEKATVKANANFDNLDSKTLNTGNATLDKLLQAVVSAGRKQLSSSASVAGNQGTVAGNHQAAPNVAPNNSNSQAPASSANAASPQAPAANSNTVSAATSYGITNYDPAKLERNRSRVPYDFSKIADSSNPAWTFNPGVLEKILDTSRQRGYITGNNFILERVTIINGNGYYNLFKPDGTYLFSINAKTGYFVGNAPGHAEALDY